MPCATKLLTKLTAPRRRRGVSTMLSLGVLVVTLTLGAAVLDIGRLAVARGRLQSSADALARAGAMELQDMRVLVPGAAHEPGLDPAQIVAWQASQATQVMQQMLTEQTERGALMAETTAPTATMQLGTYDPQTGQFNEWKGHGAPAAVQVRLSYTAAAGNPLKLFLAPLVGQGDVEATTTAYLARNVVGFQATPTANVPLVPLLIDSDDADRGWYAQAMTKTRGDQNDRYAVAATGEIYGEQDDVPELTFTIHRDASTDANAWLLSLGEDKENSWRRLATDGLRDDELTQLARPLRGAAAADSRTLQETLTALQGVKRIWPLGKKNQSGSLELTGFAAGQVVECSENEQGELTLIIQPCLLQTETAILGSGAAENPWIGKLVMAY